MRLPMNELDETHDEKTFDTQMINPIIGINKVITIANGTFIAYIKTNIPIIINALLMSFNNTSVYKVRSDSTSLVIRVTQLPIGKV